MKINALNQAMAVLMGALCTVPVYAQSIQPYDFIIGCKVFMKPKASSTSRYYLQTSSTTTKSGTLKLVTGSANATIFLFGRGKNWYHGKDGTGYIMVPQGTNCVGFNKNTSIKKGAVVQVSPCKNMAVKTWLVDKEALPGDPDTFSLSLGIDQSYHMSVDTVAAGKNLKVVPMASGATRPRTQKFYTINCRWGNNQKFMPKSGT